MSIDLFVWCSYGAIIAAFAIDGRGCNRQPAQLQLRKQLWIVSTATLMFIGIAHYASGLPEFSSIYRGLNLQPLSDAAGYFNGAIQIHHGEPLGQFESRRPLYSAFLATLMWLTNSTDYRTLAFATHIALIAPLGLFFLLGLQRLGCGVATFTYVLCFWYYTANCAGLFMTENLGFMLGLLSASAFLKGTGPRAGIWDGVGFSLLLLASLARPGMLFVVPAVFVGFLITRPKNRPRVTLTLLLAGSLAFGFEIAARELTDASRNYSGSNFAENLSGLVFGGKGWDYVYLQQPDIRQLPDAERSEKLFAIALDHFIKAPNELGTALLNSLNQSLVQGVIAFFLPKDAILLLFQLPFILGLIVTLRLRGDPLLPVLYFTGVGTILSSPFVLDGGYHGRIIAATGPLTFLLLGVGADHSIKALSKVRIGPPGQSNGNNEKPKQ